MRYLVQSTAVWDTIRIPGRPESVDAPGGAGFYALAGIKVWEDSVGLVTGIGEDYFPRFGNWYLRNRIAIDGMSVRDKHTPRTIVHYRSDGARTEEPVYGAAHYHKMEARTEDLAPFCGDARGVYVFKNADPSYWKSFLALKRRYGFTAMWEISADAATPENRGVVQQIAEAVDNLSINRGEAVSLLGKERVEDAIADIRSWDVPLIYLRLGSAGVCLLSKGQSVYVPSVPGITAADATGGGNSSSGGALVGYCRGCSLKEIGAMGNVSASFCIGQWGAPADFDETLRREARKRAEAVLTLVP